ncbi:hypothetical protein ACF0H5_021033 [Mactra antiquata]
MEHEGNDTNAVDDFHIEFSMFETVLHRLDLFVLIPLGILGNILIIIILMQKKNRQYASSMIFTSLAVSDTIILVHGIYLYTSSPEKPTSVECKLSAYFGFTSAQASSMLLAVVASERVLAVTMPHKVKSVFSVKNVRWLIIFIASFLCIMNVCILLSYDINLMTTGVFAGCDPVGQLLYFMSAIYPWIDFCFAFALPFVIIMFSSIVIIARISGNARSRRNDKIHSVTRTLLAANIAFLFTTCPFGIYQIFYPTPPSDDTKYLLYSGLITLSQANASLNFFLYFLSGPKFRADFKEFFKCCIPRQASGTQNSRSIWKLSSATTK